MLADGDPGFFGVVRTLRAPEFGLEVEVVPAVSSVAAAFARAGMPWDDAEVVVAHPRTLRRAVNVCRAHTKVAVLTSPGAGPAELGLLMEGVHRSFVICEELGTAREQVTVVTSDKAADHTWRDPNVVIVIGGPVASGDSAGWIAGRDPSAGPRGWTLPAGEYGADLGEGEREPVRIGQLARLGPGLGDLVWDIGCGSGAFATDAARAGAAVIAVDHDRHACARTDAAARRHGVQMQIVHGAAPQILENLPEPDVVRVGGEGGRGLRRGRPPSAAHRHARGHPRRRRTDRPEPDGARLPRRVRPPPVRRTRHQGLDGKGTERRVPAQRGAARPRPLSPIAVPVIGLSYCAR